MPLKRLSGLLKRNKKPKEELERNEEQEERKAIIGEMSESFQNMGSTMEQVQGHLQGSHEALQQLPELLQGQQDLCRQVIIAQEANQGLLSKVQEYFDQRDQAQQAIIDHVSSINTAMHEHADRHHQQMTTLVNSYRSGRRMLVLTIVFMAAVGTCLLALLLVVALRPDLLVVQSQLQSPAHPAFNPHLLEASQSNDPAIRRRAIDALSGQ
jgi:hypothetical protein